MKSHCEKKIILIILFVLSSGTENSQGDIMENMFFTQLVQLEQLYDCSIIISDHVNNTTGDESDLQRKIIGQMSVETLNDKWTFSSEWKKEKGESNKICAERLKNPLKRVKKHGKNCILFLTVLDKEIFTSTSTSSSNTLFDFLQYLTPGINSIVKRHEDYFVFVAKSHPIIDKILLHENIAYRLKYKMGIVYDDTKGSKVIREIMRVKMKTLFLYGGINGQGKVIENHHLYLYDSKYSRNNDVEERILDFETIFPDLTKNLNGKRIILASIKSSPMVRIRKIIGQDGDEEYVAEGKGGMQYQNFFRVATVMNFTFKIIMATGGGGSGMKFPNGTWNGEIGDVLTGIADVGILAGINAGRYEAVDFTSFHQYMSLLLLHGPTPPIYTWRALFWPFSKDLWFGIIASIIIVITYLNIIRSLHISWPTSNWRPEQHELMDPPELLSQHKLRSKIDQMVKIQRLGESHDLKKDTWNFQETVAFIIPSFLLQSYMIPRSDATKTFSIFWFIFIIVISTIYSSRLFGLFVSPPMERSPMTMEELAVSDYKIHMTYYGGFLHHWFKSSKNKSAPREIFKIWHLEHPTVCMKRAFIPKFACIAYYTDFEIMQAGLKVVHGKNRQIIHRPLDAFQIVLGMVIQKHWILSKSFNRVTGSSFDIGLTGFWAKDSGAEDRQAQARLKLDKVKRTYNETDNIWPEPKVTSVNVSLTLLHLKGAFTVFLVGIIIALLCYLVEKFLKLILIIPRLLFPNYQVKTIVSFNLLPLKSRK